MKKLTPICFCFIMMLCSTFSSYAQSGKEQRLSKKANQSYYLANYGKCIPMFEQLIQLNPNDFGYNYKLGISLFYSSKSSDKLKAAPYFEAALKNMTDTMPEIYYYLGQTCQIAQRFDDAIKYNTTLKYYVSISQSAIKDIDEIDNYIKQCENGKEFIKNPMPVKITNLGPNINTEFAEFSAVISGDESTMIFTSRRTGTTGNEVDDEDGRLYSDVYISKNNGTTWTPAEKIDKGDRKKHAIKAIFKSPGELYSTINTWDHDASIALSTDGKTLYLYRTNHIWSSTLKDGKWSKPEPLNENINSPKSQEPSVTQSADGNTLYVISDRTGGLGGKDIYRSTKGKDGQWAKLENLGPIVNTKFDEDGVFIHPDGKTLFFSSTGHDGMGGYDIYKTILENGKWSKPVNLGYPINTSADDIFFVINEKGDHAYYTSIKKGDNIGDLDIYAITPKEVPNISTNIASSLGDPKYIESVMDLNLKLTKSGGSAVKITNVVAAITSNDNTPSDAVLTIANKKLNPDNNQYITDDGSGKKKFYLIPGESYSINYKKDGYPSNPVEFTVPENTTADKFYQKVDFQDVKDASGNIISKNVVVYNAFFNIDSAVASNPAFSSMPKEQAYSDFIKTLDPNNNTLNFKAYTFTEKIIVMPVTSTITAIAANNNKNNNKSNNNSNNNNNNNNNNNSNSNSNSNNNKTAPKNSFTLTGAVAVNDPTATDPSDYPGFNPILFDYAKTLLRDEATAEMDKIYQYLKDHKNVRLEIYGHTDSKGTDEYNGQLSVKRAGTVKKYFTDKGIAYTRIKAIGKGESQPVAPNENPDKSDNPDGRQLNRRVEFKLVPASGIKIK